MITGKTGSGFEFSVREDIGRDWRVMEAVAESQSGDAAKIMTATVRIAKILLGEAGVAALSAHVAEEDGFVSTTRMEAEISEIFKAVSAQSKEVKN